MASVGRERIGYSWTAARAGVMPRIVSAYYWEIPSRDVTGRSLHAFWVLDYPRSDGGRVRVGSPRGRWWTREPRVAHLYPPGTPYWEDTSGVRGPIHEAYVMFAGGDEAGLRSLVGRGQCFARVLDEGGQLGGPLHDIALTGHTLGEGGFWKAQAGLAGLFDLLGSAVAQGDGTVVLPGASAGADESATGLVGQAEDYFRSHLGETITLAAVARHLAMSPSSFSHRYAQEAGRSPMAALTALRIDLARSLLLRGLKLDAIARQTGFFDAYHLSKTFKKHCGVSPSAFRRGFWPAVER